MTARSAAARFAAPVAFLLAATIAILLVRSVLADEAPAGSSPPAATTSATTKPTPTTTRAATTAATPHETYAIRARDTFGVVADRYDTTVETLVGLNPGIDPTSLQVGQEIRVK